MARSGTPARDPGHLAQQAVHAGDRVGSALAPGSTAASEQRGETVQLIPAAQLVGVRSREDERVREQLSDGTQVALGVG